jgi:predicted RNase H-like HicB family nuclease
MAASVARRAVSRQPQAMKRLQLTALLEREGDGFVALCPELDVASQGDDVQDALNNLREAVELFLECAPPEEVARRHRSEVFVTRFEAAYA